MMMVQKLENNREFNGIHYCLLIVLLSLLIFPLGYASPSEKQIPFNATIRDDNGNLLDASRNFKFALINNNGTEVYWTHDGSSSLPPTSSLTFNIVKGNLSVMLGDTGVTNMNAIPDVAFNSGDVYLRIWVESTVTAGQFDQLSVDKKMSSVPFAYRALTFAGNQLDGVAIGQSTSSSANFTNLSALSLSLNGANFPATLGSNGQVLSVDASGNLVWAVPVIGANTFLSNIGDLAAFRQGLGLALGSNVQAFDAQNANFNQAGSILVDWTNTAHPWVDNEVSDALTITGGSITNSPISGSTGSFTSLQASSNLTVTGSATLSGLNYPSTDGSNGQVLKTNGAGLIQWAADVALSLTGNESITGDWVNTANPWADNEVVDALTINGGTITNSPISGSTGAFTSLQTSGNFSVTGAATLSGINYPSSDGSSGQVLKTDGSGNLLWSTDSTLSLSGNETITGDWVNTANPWSDNEVSDALTINGGTITNSPISGSTGSFTTLTASDVVTLSGANTNLAGNLTVTGQGNISGLVYPNVAGSSNQFLQTDGQGNLNWATPAGAGDAVLANAETITGNWVNTANPWADNEVVDALTITGGTISNSPISGSTGSFTTVTASSNLTVSGSANLSGLLYPALDGTAGQFLNTNGSGALSWTNLVIAASQMSNDVVSGANVVDGSVATADLANDAITSAKIADGTIVSADIATGAITISEIGADAVGSSEIAAGAVGASEIANDSITAADIGANAVTTSEILDGTVATADLADSSITTSKIATNAISSSHIATSAVTSTEIATNAVTSQEIIAGAVTSAKLDSNLSISSNLTIGENLMVTGNLVFGSSLVSAINDEDNFASNSDSALATQQSIKAYVDNQVSAVATTLGGLSDTNIAAAGAGHILVHDGTSTWDNKAVTGDISMSNSGAATLNNGSVDTVHLGTMVIGSSNLDSNSITSAKILDGSVATADLANSSVTSAIINDGDVANTDLAANSVTTDKIAADTIQADDIATGNVTTSEILDGTIATADIASNAITSAKLSSNLSLSGTLTLGGNLSSSGNITLEKDLKTDRHLHSDTNTFLGMSVVGFGNIDNASSNDGFYNTAVGYKAHYKVSTGSYNVAIGPSALFNSSTGSNNSAVGFNALHGNSSGSYNTAMGFNSMYGSSISGTNNSAFGTYSLYSLTSGTQNSTFGKSSMKQNTTGQSNSGFGVDALYHNVVGDYNVALGAQAGMGSSGQSHSQNTLIGYRSGYALSTGGNNVFIGYLAGDATTTGERNIIIGHTQDAPTAATNDHLNIGGTIYGDLQNGLVGIGTSTTTHRLTLPNTSGATGGEAIAYSWQIYSSKRYKENIRPIDSALDKVKKMRGVYYDSRPDHGGLLQVGFIAEEVGAVLPSIVTWEDNGTDALSMDYTRISALNLQAIKELEQNNSETDSVQSERIDRLESEQHVQIEQLKSENVELKKHNEDLEKRLKRLEELLLKSIKK